MRLNYESHFFVNLFAAFSDICKDLGYKNFDYTWKQKKRAFCNILIFSA